MVKKLVKNGLGLNLSREVLDGIVCHTGKTRASTLEGRVVALSDRIAMSITIPTMLSGRA